MKVTFFFAWYDFWIGGYYDRFKEILYICPLPCCVIRISFREELNQHPCSNCDFEFPDICMDCEEFIRYEEARA